MVENAAATFVPAHNPSLNASLARVSRVFHHRGSVHRPCPRTQIRSPETTGEPFFYLTNKRDVPVEEIVWESNERCNQENLIAQLKSGVHALETPLDNLLSNWAYMVMASLAWSLKAWFGLLLPEKGRWASKYKAEKRAVIRMEFKSFVNAFIRVPAQIIRQGRKTIYRLLAWNPWQPVFLRGFDQLATTMRC